MGLAVFHVKALYMRLPFKSNLLYILNSAKHRNLFDFVKMNDFVKKNLVILGIY